MKITKMHLSPHSVIAGQAGRLGKFLTNSIFAAAVLTNLALSAHAEPSNKLKKDGSSTTVPLNFKGFKNQLSIGITATCLLKANGFDLYKSLKVMGATLSASLMRDNNGYLENRSEPLTSEQATKLYSNEISLQMLQACPKVLSQKETKTIESLKKFIETERSKKIPTK
jgi:hypothetical protein